ncbi:MAG: TadE/TadG family type IV pilus assembly protein [Methylocella sp.]
MANKHRDAGDASNCANPMTRMTLFDDQRGVTAVEFALTLPLFLLLLFGVWQISFGLWAQVALQHGAEAAARCMSVTPPTNCGTIAGAQNFAAKNSYGLNPSPSIFTVSYPTGCNQISADYAVSPAAASFGIPAFTVHAQACYASHP